MRKILFLMLSVLLPMCVSAINPKRVSVHDPSVVWDPASQTYYIFGSHRDHAKSTDMINWTKITVPWATETSTNANPNVAFATPQVTKIKKGGVEYDFAFDAVKWSARGGTQGQAKYDVTGNQWAPDVIYNKVMNKWCMYLSVNGDNWYSSIILLTADNIEGPYRYQAPVVISGFHVGDVKAYKDTDLEIVIGTQDALPDRYAKKAELSERGNWGEYWPNNIDPCVFYDEEGKLWMSYGSWSGGIWMLELDESTGLRDYDVNYELTGSDQNITVDPYFGKKIAGGYYVSGEASYIEYIGGWYFLFVTYGGLEAAGGYQMRVFRSDKPDGPYVDARNTDAIFKSYKLNFGPDASDNRGVNIFGAYNNWGNQVTGNNGERSQGHNSIIAAEDGRTYLVYHTRFQNRGEEHQVRVHQVFQNEDGWLVAAPFEYTGEQVKSEDIAATQQIPTIQIPGTWQLLIHNFKLDHTKKETVKPVEIQLNADGTVSGDQTGSWSAQEGSSYFNIKIGTTEYKGVMIEQTLEPSDDKAIAFTAMNRNGVTVWGYQTAQATGIKQILNSKSADRQYYDLMGRPVTTPQRKGIYILNGKKVIR
jgi:arabinan endo-1,5-alpha-L-arabinosidase